MCKSRANFAKLLAILLDRSNQYLCKRLQLDRQLNENDRGYRKFPGATARLTRQSSSRASIQF